MDQMSLDKYLLSHNKVTQFNQGLKLYLCNNYVKNDLYLIENYLIVSKINNKRKLREGNNERRNKMPSNSWVKY